MSWLIDALRGPAVRLFVARVLQLAVAALAGLLAGDVVDIDVLPEPVQYETEY